MIFEDPLELKQRIAEVTERPVNGQPVIYKDTTAFMSIDRGNVLRLSGDDYVVLGHAYEGRFGLDEQPKFWVKTALDLTSGKRKIIKMIFHEAFTCRIGSTLYLCVRNPEKEAAILREKHGNPYYMQGKAVHDEAGNLVRIIDYIPGLSLYERLRRMQISHKDFYHQVLPTEMQAVIGCLEAIAQLHREGSHHGDIRADHIRIDRDTGAYVWIDFDYEINQLEYDVFCLGNVLLQVVGKGRHSIYDIDQQPSAYPDLEDTLVLRDMSLMFRHRVANLKKLFPHISTELNDILMRFSFGSKNPYRDVDSLLSDLYEIYPPE